MQPDIAVKRSTCDVPCIYCTKVHEIRVWILVRRTDAKTYTSISPLCIGTGGLKYCYTHAEKLCSSICTWCSKTVKHKENT